MKRIHTAIAAIALVAISCQTEDIGTSNPATEAGSQEIAFPDQDSGFITAYVDGQEVYGRPVISSSGKKLLAIGADQLFEYSLTPQKAVFEPGGTNFEAGKNFVLSANGCFGFFGIAAYNK